MHGLFFATRLIMRNPICSPCRKATKRLRFILRLSSYASHNRRTRLPIVGSKKRVKCLRQGWPACPQFSTVFKREFSQYLFSFCSDTDKNTPQVFLVTTTLNESALREPVYQFNHTVMLKL